MLGTRRGGHLLTGFVLLAGSLIACSPLFQPRWFPSHDILTHIQRVFAVCYEMAGGDFYPRWLSQAALGKGLPDLNFYSPASYLVVGWFHHLGIRLEVVLKAACFGSLFLGAWGFYLWVRRFCDEVGSLIGATLYLFVPYHFVDLYVRGAYPELAALLMLPWLFYALDLSFSPDQRTRGVLLTALTSAGVVLTHHLTTLMIVPFGMVYFGWHALAERSHYRRILAASLGPFLGCGLSAFYWLPMVVETRYVASFKYSGDIWDHFVYPYQWFLSSWGFGASLPGPDDQMSFQIGAVLVASVAVTALLFYGVPRRERSFGLLALGLGLFGLFMTTSLSGPLYELIPPLRYFRHPWRFLGPATMFLAAFAGLVTRSRPLDARPWLRWVLLAAVSIASVALSSDQRAVSGRFSSDLDLAEAELVTTREIGGLNYDIDFSPSWAVFDPEFPIRARLWTTPQGKSATVWALQARGSTMSFSMASGEPLGVVVPFYYFPGWKLRVDGASTPVTVDPNGFITFNMPAGAHHVKLWFGTTWPRIVGWLIAAVAVLITWGLYLPALQRAPEGAGN